MKPTDGRWVTINGAHVFVKNGQSVDDALNERKKRNIGTSAHSGSIIPGKENIATIPLDYFSNKRGKEIKFDVENAKNAIPKEARGFLNQERLNTHHHRNHATEMGYKSQQDYNRAANDYWENGDGKIHYSPKRDRYYKYNSRSEHFISVDSDGVVHTFMLLSNRKFKEKIIQEQLYEFY